MRQVCLLVTLISIACASAPIKPQNRRALAQADVQILEGCYDCLLEARGTYLRLAVGRARPLILQRLFEIELLITLRERELALDGQAALERARALAKELPATLLADRYLEIVEAVPWDDVGWPRQESQAFAQAHGNLRQQIDNRLKELETGALSQPVRQYLALSLDCGYPVRVAIQGQTVRNPAPREAPAGTLPPGTPRAGAMSTSREPLADAPPLVAYRGAICRDMRGDTSTEILDRIRTDIPRFVETSLFLGRYALAKLPASGPAKARAFAQEAYARFATSPAVTYLYGALGQASGDCRLALRYFDETIAIKSLHEDALLGRAVCLSLLKQPLEAIETATDLIDRRAYNYGQAYYWRAWNHHQRKELERARMDVDRAKTLLYNSSLLTLAGMIEHDQNDLDIAEKDLTTAKSLDATNCTANWYLALVALKRERWLNGANEFVDAMKCYNAGARDTERRKQQLEARTDLDLTFKTQQLEGFETAIKEDRSQESASAYNAAFNFLRGGDRAAAMTHIDLAARDPERLEKAAELQKVLLDNAR